ncbi:glycosyltransferase [Subtercola sp. YIM 133946]|uniref:glycosyltransferase n=1 Tax=Subtercola sp. YIM 133946 TaxID=3118909 RepID=UPI002F951852
MTDSRLGAASVAPSASAPFDAVTPPPPSPATTAALGQRLGAAAAVLLAGHPAGHVDDLLARGNGVLADALVRHVQQTKVDSELWLVLVALTAAFPDVEFFLGVRRSLGVTAPEFALSSVFETIQQSYRPLKCLDSELEIVTDRPVADVDFCAKYDHNTGIQRVVRETFSRWIGDHELELACWSAGDNALRELSPVERRRVVDWDAWKQTPPASRPTSTPPGFRPRLVVPYATTVLLPEVARDGYWSALSSLAQFSGNRVGLIGYDTIPIASADLIAENESEKFAKYLSIVKNADRVAAISASAADEFRGFARAASAQGIPPATVVSVPLAVQTPTRGTAPARRAGQGRPASKLVLMVGNQEPRKNNLAVLFAAETLWREGLDFRLRMIGGGSSEYTRFVDREVKRLARAGHAVELLRGAPDSVLVDSYAEAHCTVFPSTHEGFGLPVAESLAMGVPSITTDYGSTLEIAEGGGCLTVDPRDDRQLVAALRSMLTEPGVHERLVAEAEARPPRDWNDYAAELWHDLVDPLERDLR